MTELDLNTFFGRQNHNVLIVGESNSGKTVLIRDLGSKNPNKIIQVCPGSYMGDRHIQEFPNATIVMNQLEYSWDPLQVIDDHGDLFIVYDYMDLLLIPDTFRIDSMFVLKETREPDLESRKTIWERYGKRVFSSFYEFCSALDELPEYTALYLDDTRDTHLAHVKDILKDVTFPIKGNGTVEYDMNLNDSITGLMERRCRYKAELPFGW